jgi:glutathione S-transferase
MSALTLYNFDLDENCYRVRLLISMLSLEARCVAVDMVPGLEHLKRPVIELNPLGDIPVLTDGELVISGPAAILAYLARRYGGEAWAAPADPALYAQHASWLEFAAGALPSARQARLVSLFGLKGDLANPASKGRHALRLMEDHMTRSGFDDGVWFVGKHASIVDIALFPAFALSRDWGVGHEEFPALRRWARRFRALPGFRTMPGIPDYQ